VEAVKGKDRKKKVFEKIFSLPLYYLIPRGFRGKGKKMGAGITMRGREGRCIRRKGHTLHFTWSVFLGGGGKRTEKERSRMGGLKFAKSPRHPR